MFPLAALSSILSNSCNAMSTRLRGPGCSQYLGILLVNAHTTAGHQALRRGIVAWSSHPLLLGHSRDTWPPMRHLLQMAKGEFVKKNWLHICIPFVAFFSRASRRRCVSSFSSFSFSSLSSFSFSFSAFISLRICNLNV
jgi:hypothetical protein